jgi:hypothetical protein
MTHDAAIELLPWLINGSLDGEERDAVADHATSCVICRRELDELEVLQQSVETLASRGVSPEPDMRRINARIDAQLQRESRGNALIAAWRRFSSSRWRLAFAVQTAVLVIVVGVVLMPAEPEPQFTTMTSAEELPAGHYLRVVFDPTLDDVAIAGIVETNGLSVFTGPTDRGVITLRFGDALAADERDSALASMRGDARVLFAEPVRRVN